MPRLLIIEKHKAMQAKLQQLFESEGYGVNIADKWAEGHNMLPNAPPAVLVLDLEMAEGNPRRLFDAMRLAHGDIPIIVLGGSSSVIDRILCLEMGADDYVLKPFNGRELVARVRAALRRSERHNSELLAFDEVQIDFRKMEARRLGALVSLTAQEFKILKFMSRNVERAISREELLNEVWGYHSYPTTRTVDNHILRLRQKLERQPSDPVHFLTVHRVGYKFVPHLPADTRQ
ncbi:MAG: response regulator transcription factor [Acidobacteria bacterium]|nr:response regulator transcription factor [Acidobacteriota bacterium]MBV9484073.1 response regulator transcription factor [Acidobacteriota bacterium]